MRLLKQKHHFDHWPTSQKHPVVDRKCKERESAREPDSETVKLLLKKKIMSDYFFGREKI